MAFVTSTHSLQYNSWALYPSLSQATIPRGVIPTRSSSGSRNTNLWSSLFLRLYPTDTSYSMLQKLLLPPKKILCVWFWFGLSLNTITCSYHDSSGDGVPLKGSSQSAPPNSVPNFNLLSVVCEKKKNQPRSDWHQPLRGFESLVCTDREEVKSDCRIQLLQKTTGKSLCVYVKGNSRTVSYRIKTSRNINT